LYGPTSPTLDTFVICSPERPLLVAHAVAIIHKLWGLKRFHLLTPQIRWPKQYKLTTR